MNPKNLKAVPLFRRVYYPKNRFTQLFTPLCLFDLIDLFK